MVRLTIVLLIFTVVACGGSGNPSSPGPSTQPDRVRMAEGQYRFSAQMNPFDPRYPACPGSFTPSLPGVIVQIPVSAKALVRYEDGDWVARPETATDGDFEVRFRDTGAAAQVGVVPVRGSARGVIAARGNDGATIFASFAGLQTTGPAEIEGIVMIAGATTPSLPYSLARGMARGEVAFWSQPGGRSTCQIVDWMLIQVVTP